MTVTYFQTILTTNSTAGTHVDHFVVILPIKCDDTAFDHLSEPHHDPYCTLGLLAGAALSRSPVHALEGSYTLALEAPCLT